MNHLKILPAYLGAVADLTGIEAEVCLDIAQRQALRKKKYPTELALNRAKSAAALARAQPGARGRTRASAGAAQQ